MKRSPEKEFRKASACLGARSLREIRNGQLAQIRIRAVPLREETVIGGLTASDIEAAKLALRRLSRNA